ncbi:brachyurin-like isoform X1 [Neocloeon triangulifer]|uniref:brachyurin-like isoform X1 n=1 Tax=Neocloeon triangulifer TaxID=2078957 RepID=UPI00286F5072|nr:brachyurin-like isoform X1 [Neocloeon triangulifer]
MSSKLIVTILVACILQVALTLKPLEKLLVPKPNPNFNDKAFDKANKYTVDFRPKGTRKQEESAGNVAIKVNDQIVGGKEASRGQVPWQALLTISKQYTCGGSLIDPSWVMTAGHCCNGFSPSDYLVSLGLVNRTGAETSRVDVNVTAMFLHPEFDETFLTKDICLLKLDKKIDTSGVFITTVRLPKIADAKKTLFGLSGIVSGWGKYEDDASGDTSNDLKFLNRKVIDTKLCAKQYGNVTVNSALMCIGNGDKQGSCNGDSGGPFVGKENDNKFTQVGLVSFGSAYSCVDYPSGFTRVSAYLGWVANVTGVQPRP